MQNRRRQLSLVATVAVIVLTAGCGEDSSPTAPSAVELGPRIEAGGAAAASAPTRGIQVGDGRRGTSSASGGTPPSTTVVAAVRELTATAVYSRRTSRNDSVEVSWKHPLTTTGTIDARVTSYEISYNGGTASSMLASNCTGSGTAGTCTTTYTQMADGTHTFSIVPQTTLTWGTSATSATTSITLAAAVPGVVRDLAGEQVALTNHALLTWKVPLESGTQNPDTSVTSYELRMEGYSYSTAQASVACTGEACSVTRDGHSYATFTYAVRAINSAGNGPYSFVEVPITEAVHDGTGGTPAQPDLTAVFGTPSRSLHKGKRFTIKLTFSESVRVRGYRVVRDEALTTTNATITRAQRRPRGQNAAWRLTVEPTDASKTVTIAVPETTSCTATGALCTSDGRMLTPSVSVAVPAQ